jgi:hypothetical protein
MFAWIKCLTRFGRRQHREEKVRERYRLFATRLGDSLSYLHMDDAHFRFENEIYSIRDTETYHYLNELEEAYANLGYRIIPLDVWIDHGGWGVSLDEYWRVPREEDERPIFTSFEVEELPAPSPMLDLVIETGKSYIQETDDNGDIICREIDNGGTNAYRSR